MRYDNQVQSSLLLLLIHGLYFEIRQMPNYPGPRLRSGLCTANNAIN